MSQASRGARSHESASGGQSPVNVGTPLHHQMGAHGRSSHGPPSAQHSGRSTPTADDAQMSQPPPQHILGNSGHGQDAPGTRGGNSQPSGSGSKPNSNGNVPNPPVGKTASRAGGSDELAYDCTAQDCNRKFVSIHARNQHIRLAHKDAPMLAVVDYVPNDAHYRRAPAGGAAAGGPQQPAAQPQTQPPQQAQQQQQQQTQTQPPQTHPGMSSNATPDVKEEPSEEMDPNADRRNRPRRKACTCGAFPEGSLAVAMLRYYEDMIRVNNFHGAIINQLGGYLPPPMPWMLPPLSSAASFGAAAVVPPGAAGVGVGPAAFFANSPAPQFPVGDRAVMVERLERERERAERGSAHMRHPSAGQNRSREGGVPPGHALADEQRTVMSPPHGVQSPSRSPSAGAVHHPAEAALRMPPPDVRAELRADAQARLLAAERERAQWAERDARGASGGIMGPGDDPTEDVLGRGGGRGAGPDVRYAPGPRGSAPGVGPAGSAAAAAAAGYGGPVYGSSYYRQRPTPYDRPPTVAYAPPPDPRYVSARYSVSRSPPHVYGGERAAAPPGAFYDMPPGNLPPPEAMRGDWDREAPVGRR